jgi:hypothetical protein
MLLSSHLELWIVKEKRRNPSAIGMRNFVLHRIGIGISQVRISLPFAFTEIS